MNGNSENYIYYLAELRRRLFYSLAVLIFLFIFCIYFANDLYTVLARPLLKHLTANEHLIATSIVSPFFVPFELSFFVALFAAIPFFLYQMWSFIAPALYKHEKKMIWPLFIFSTVLFYLGLVFAYFVVFPLMFTFLVKTTPVSVTLSPDIAMYLQFTLRLFLIFGVIFEIPIMIVFCISVNIVKRSTLIRLRPYIIVLAFIIGMLLGPPDVVSQTLIAVPLWLLFEIGIFLALIFAKESSHVRRKRN